MRVRARASVCVFSLLVNLAQASHLGRGTLTWENAVKFVVHFSWLTDGVDTLSANGEEGVSVTEDENMAATKPSNWRVCNVCLGILQGFCEKDFITEVNIHSSAELWRQVGSAVTAPEHHRSHLLALVQGVTNISSLKKANYSEIVVSTYCRINKNWHPACYPETVSCTGHLTSRCLWQARATQMWTFLDCLRLGPS